MAIQAVMEIREVFGLPNRAAEGFVNSIFRLLKASLKSPDHSTLSRRGKDLRVRLPVKAQGPVHLLMDSSGLKVYGEGEWKVRQHGYSKRRTWRKLHVAVDAKSREIQASLLTEADVHDSEVAPVLIDGTRRVIESFTGDGAYDTKPVYDAVKEHSPEAILKIPPRKDAKIKKHGNSNGEKNPRDETIRQIRKSGRSEWKRSVGYHLRSLAETTMFRLKTLFGDRLTARLLETQVTQANIRCRALNRMTFLGMPEAVKIE
jgi:hypothetical protein